MKKIYLLIVILLSLTAGSFAQVTVTGSTGANGTYTSLTNSGGAFDAINTFPVQTGNNIVITISANLLSELGSAPLYQSDWASLVINPTGGSGITVSGSVSGPLVDISGADLVTINGLNSGGNSLTISNTNTGASASTIRFVNGATNNTITNCTVLGSSGSSLSSGLGTIFFSTSAIGGNTGNTISNNNIGPAGANLPIYGIYSSGTGPANANTVTVTNNNIYDYYNTNSSSCGMNINIGNSDWVITNNKFYQTATRIYSTGSIHYGIYINVGSNYTITGNVIGYANSAGTGTTNMIGLTSGSLGGTFPSSYTVGGVANATRFVGINCQLTAGGTASSIQNNTIAGIALYTSSNNSTGSGMLCGIALNVGNANIGTVTGNTIGSTTGTSSLYAASTLGSATVVGFYISSSNTVTVQNNNIGAIDASGTSATTACGFRGIDVSSSGAGVFVVSNNTIGNSTPNNIRTGYLLTGANLSNTATTPTTASGASAITGIINSVSSSVTLDLNNNTLQGFLMSGSATTFTGITNASVISTTINIQNNNLGTAAAGLLTVAFANSGAIVGIANTQGSATAALSITGNTITGMAYNAACTGAFQCISSTFTVATENISNNNFTNLTVNTSNATQGFLIGASNATPVVTVSGNAVVTQFTNSNAVGGANYFGIANLSAGPTTGSSTVSNNILSNISVRTTTSYAAMIYWAPGTGATCTHNITVTGNVLYNDANVSAGTSTQAASLFGIVTSSGSTNLISNNDVSFLSATGGAVTGILPIGNSTNTTTGNTTVRNNIVHDIKTTSVYSGTAAGSANGIQIQSGPVNNYVYKNKIYNISSVTSGSFTGGTVTGMTIVQATATCVNNVYNNYIGQLYATNSTFYQSVRGISIANAVANTTNVYYNTIYLDGTPGLQSYCLYMSNTTANSVLRNNIFINKATSASGDMQSVIFRNGTSSLGTYSTASNNNILYCGTPGALNLIYADGAVNALTNTQQTLANFQTFVGPTRENLSKTENPPFLSTTGSSNAFLHINPSIATQAESGAVNIATYTDDYDGDVRQGNAGYPGTSTGTAPDIGADEFDGTNDNLSPDISYTLMAITTCLTNPTFTATITDASNVNTTIGTRPRVYYKKSTNANSLGATNTNTTDGWKWVEASNAASPFSFTIDYSLIYGGVAAGANIQYFVTAQDLASTPNVAITSGSFAATASSVALTGAAFPIAGLINSYNINSTIPTSVTIGAAGTYTSLSGASGLFADINNKGLSGNTVVNIIDPSVTETGIYALNQMTGSCGATTYTLTIKPNAAGTTLTGAFANGPLLRIKSNNVIIDGSSNGSSSQDLTITNTSATSPNVIVLGSTGTTPIANSTLKNCIIINGINTSSAVIVSDGAAATTAGYFNNISIQNNNIQKAFVGVYCIANVASGNGSGLTLTGNSLSASGTNAIRRVALYLQGIDGATVSGNTIGNFETATAENDVAIWLASNTVNTTVSGNTIGTINYTGVSANAPVGIYITSGVASTNNMISANAIYGLSSGGTSTIDATSGIEVAFATSGVTIKGNSIGNIQSANAGGYGANGIWLASTLTSNVASVYNNFIFDVTGYGNTGVTPSSNGYGIVVSSGAGYKIYFNSVYLITNPTLVTSIPAPINITSGVSAAGAIDLRNNIFVNYESATTERYAIYCGAANTVFSNIDYNDYLTSGPNLGYLGVSLLNLAAIQASFGGNTNSLNVIPYFTSPLNLHLVAGTNCALDGYGTPIATFTTDYDGQTRDAGAPDMGADEFTTTPAPSTITTASNCDTKNVSPLGTLYVDGSCNLIAKVLPSGGAAVAGKIKTCATLDVTQQYFNAQPYVQRHYDIEPSVSPSTATGTITLYFTDAEFDLYNTTNPVWPKLPTVANGGNGSPYLGNVKVTQFHGVGSTNPTKPGFYPGTTALITPVTTFYNGSFWELTFNVTGFSGFYVHTNVYNAPLPVVVNYLTGRRQGSNHLLNWKVTCATSPRATMTLERGADARNYTGIYTITADAARCNQPFDYTDANPLTGMNYYRLKIVDVDGKVTYSTTVALLNAVKGFDIVSIAPNPVVADNFKLNVASAQSSKMELTIFDMQGRLVNRQSISVIAGYNSLPINVASLQAGTYTIQAIIADDKSKVIRFVKQ